MVVGHLHTIDLLQKSDKAAKSKSEEEPMTYEALKDLQPGDGKRACGRSPQTFEHMLHVLRIDCLDVYDCRGSTLGNTSRFATP
jgi:hypothetical protein